MTTIALPQNNNGLHGTLSIPGDKSISHRSVMFGAISEGRTTVDHFLFSDDCLRTIAAFRALGVKIETTSDQVTIEGKGGFDQFENPDQPLDMGNSGTSTRLLLGLLARQPFDIEMVGDASLRRRPLNRVIEPLAQMGAQISARDNNLLPLTLHANRRLQEIDYQLPVASAQVKSALILAGLQADQPTQLTEKLITRDHTEKMLQQFGGSIQQEGKHIKVTPQSEFQGQHISVPGDISSAAFFIVAGLCVPNSKVVLQQVGLNPTRTGILSALSKMGAQFEISNETAASEPAGDITIHSQQLQAINLTDQDIPGLVDEVPLIALAATQATGTTVISGAEELRVKETDRIETVTEELKKMGADIEQRPDGFVINGGTKLHSAVEPLDSHGDHRIGMMLAVANLIAGGTGQLQHADAINISYPTFWQDVAQLQS